MRAALARVVRYADWVVRLSGGVVPNEVEGLGGVESKVRIVRRVRRKVTLLIHQREGVDAGAGRARHGYGVAYARRRRRYDA